jgi:protein gp37
MGDSKIEWTDKVWNPVRGCVKVSAGCKHCYAETFAERWRGIPVHAYEQGFDLRLVPEKLEEPLKWKGSHKVFVNSMSDLFQDGVPDEFIDKVFGVMAATPQNTYQILTKRPARMLAYLDAAIRRTYVTIEWMRTGHAPLHQPSVPWPLPNVWIGTSVENQEAADERIPILLSAPAAVRWISAEPLLGPLALKPFFWSVADEERILRMDEGLIDALDLLASVLCEQFADQGLSLGPNANLHLVADVLGIDVSRLFHPET